MALYEFQVQVWFGAGPGTAGFPVWTDITPYVRFGDGISCSRGQQDELSNISAGNLSFTVNNDDGRFSAGRALLVGGGANPYHPLKRYTPIRLRVRYPRTVGTWYQLWQGYVDSWGNGTANGVRGRTSVTCIDIWALLGRKMRAAITEEVLRDAPAAYYPLTEATGATSVGNIAGTTPGVLKVGQANGTGGAIDFGVGSVTPDELTAAAFTPASQNEGRCLAGGNEWSGTVTAFEAVFSTTSTGSGLVVALDNAGVALDCGMIVSNGTVAASGFWPIIGTGGWNDGADHHLAVIFSAADAAGNAVLMVDGVVVGSTSALSVSVTGRSLIIGGQPGATAAGCFDGQISHAVVHTSPITVARMQAHAVAAVGLAESTFDRWTRIGGYAGSWVGAVTVGTPSATVGPQKMLDRSVAEVFQEVAAAESGRAYIDPLGSVTLLSRSSFYMRPVDLTATAAVVGQSYAATFDGQNLVNDATVARDGGATQRVVNDASVAANGVQDRSLSSIHADDDQAYQLAAWTVGEHAEPLPRYGAVDVDLVTKAASIALVDFITAEVGERFQVTGLPASYPSSTSDGFIEGVSDRMTTTEWTRTFNVSPVGLALSVWQLGTSALGTTTVLGH